MHAMPVCDLLLILDYAAVDTKEEGYSGERCCLSSSIHYKEMFG